jgi:hypothetical protein
MNARVAADRFSDQGVMILHPFSTHPMPETKTMTHPEATFCDPDRCCLLRIV